MGAITDYIDVAQLALYLFWGFFAWLVIYLQAESKREGFPLEEDGLLPNSIDRTSEGFPLIPKPKEFLLHGGRSVAYPQDNGDQRDLALKAAHAWPGSPFDPTGNPMVDGVGPASWAERDDEPDMTHEHRPKVMPIRTAPEFVVAKGDPDPRGMDVIGADDQVAGKVSEIWVDTEEQLIRYLEVDVPGWERNVLLPMNFSRVDFDRGRILVSSINADQFGQVPVGKDPDVVTRLEEDKIMGYFGGGKLYANAARREPLL